MLLLTPPYLVHISGRSNTGFSPVRVPEEVTCGTSRRYFSEYPPEQKSRTVSLHNDFSIIPSRLLYLHECFFHIMRDQMAVTFLPDLTHARHESLLFDRSDPALRSAPIRTRCISDALQPRRRSPHAVFVLPQKVCLENFLRYSHMPTLFETLFNSLPDLLGPGIPMFSG